jgi:hypothetical protein
VIDHLLLKTAPSDRLAAVLACGVSAATMDRLAQISRLQARMIELISARLGDVGDLTPDQARALAMTPDELVDLSARAGIIWYGGAIARMIDKASRQSLVSLLGEAAYGLALACVDLRPPGIALDLTPENIAKAAPLDGAACLAAWCASQSHAVSRRLQLTIPAATPQSVHAAWGPKIIGRLLADA